MKLIVEVYPDGKCYAYKETEEMHARKLQETGRQLDPAKLYEQCDLDTYRGGYFVFDIGPDEVKTDYEHLRRSLFAVIDDLSILAGDRVGPSDMSHADIAYTTSVNLHALAYAVAETRNKSGVVYPSPAEALDENKSVNYVRYKFVPVRDGMDFGLRGLCTTIAKAREVARSMMTTHETTIGPEKVIILGTYNKGQGMPEWEIVEEVC